MMERKLFGLTTRSIKRMAFELAIKNVLAHPFSVQQGTSGWKWLRNFVLPSSTEVEKFPSYFVSKIKVIHES
jgi:abortive infection bacteriophage resistance protein